MSSTPQYSSLLYAILYARKSAIWRSILPYQVGCFQILRVGWRHVTWCHVVWRHQISSLYGIVWVSKYIDLVPQLFHLRAFSWFLKPIYSNDSEFNLSYLTYALQYYTYRGHVTDLSALVNNSILIKSVGKSRFFMRLLNHGVTHPTHTLLSSVSWA